MGQGQYTLTVADVVVSICDRDVAAVAAELLANTITCMFVRKQKTPSQILWKVRKRIILTIVKDN